MADAVTPRRARRETHRTLTALALALAAGCGKHSGADPSQAAAAEGVPASSVSGAPAPAPSPTAPSPSPGPVVPSPSPQEPQDSPEAEPSPDCIHGSDHGVDSVSLGVYFLECGGDRIPGSKDVTEVPLGCRIHFNATPRDGSGAPTCSKTWPIWQVGPEELVTGSGRNTFTPAYQTRAAGVMSARCIVDRVRSNWVVLTIR